MVETQDLEVYALEITMFSESVMEALVRNSVTEIVLLDKGAYVGIYSADKHKVMTGKIYTRGVYNFARNFFARQENRGERLALLNSNGQLLTFLVWNQRAERNSRYLTKCKEQLLELLGRGYDILFEDWNEYTSEYVDYLSQQGDFTSQMFLYGRNWELDDAYARYPHTQNKDKNIITVGKEGIIYPTKETMVYSLIRMKEEYQYKSLYFYMDISSHICWFTAKFLCEFGCMPDGFCELHNQREMKDFLGKPVEDVEEVAKRSETLIVVVEQIDIDVLLPYITEQSLVRYRDLFGYDAKFLKDKIFQTWGTKEHSLALMKEMYFWNLSIPYRNFADREDIDGILLWEVMGNWTSERYKKYMKQVNSNVDLYSMRPLYESRWSTSTAVFIRNLQEALDRRKKVILYGVRSHYTSLWLHILQMFELPVQIMDDEEREDWYGYPVESVHELPFYHTDDLLLIFNQPYEDLPYAVKMLESYGISKENHNYISLYEEIDRTDRGANMIDICAGPICELLASQPIPGYVTIGGNKNCDYRIMVVGGSTSDSTLFQYRSWPEELFEILEAQDKNVTIYSGGMAGAISAQELAKLTRDIQKLKPDMVISFSGYNDSHDHRLEAGYVNGVYTHDFMDNKTWFHNWFENEKEMAAISDAYHAKFYCFAQPMLYLNENLNCYELLATKDVRRAWNPDWNWRGKVAAVRGYPWFVDLMDIFQGQTEVFFDRSHVTTKGNKIIAEHIYYYIKDDII